MDDSTFERHKSDIRVGYCLASWKKLNHRLKDLTENEVETALVIEQSNKRRMNILHRLERRLHVLRGHHVNADWPND